MKASHDVFAGAASLLGGLLLCAPLIAQDPPKVGEQAWAGYANTFEWRDSLKSAKAAAAKAGKLVMYVVLHGNLDKEC